MATRLKISKVSNVNPKTKQKGFTARVLTNGKAGYEEIVAEEVLESNRVVLANEKGNNLVSLYPKVSGSVSDNDVEQITFYLVQAATFYLV